MVYIRHISILCNNCTLMKSNRMAIRAEFCKNETMNPSVNFRNKAPAELCYRDVCT